MQSTDMTSTANNSTGNQIGDEGAHELSEALEVNTTLTELSLSSTQHQQDNDQQWLKADFKL